MTSESSPANQSLTELRLLHLADSAFPIGALAHSFGIESMVSAGLLETPELPDFFRAYIEEVSLLEAAFCRAAFQLAKASSNELDAPRWLELNDLLSARKPGRESRSGSGSLGRNFLAAVRALDELPLLDQALQASKQSTGLIHYGAAFGLAAGALGFEEHRTVLTFLHQSAASLVSACQRLLPLGQSRAASILWDLKPVIMDTADRSASCSVDSVSSFAPLLDWGAMEHPALATRLFIS